ISIMRVTSGSEPKTSGMGPRNRTPPQRRDRAGSGEAPLGTSIGPAGGGGIGPAGGGGIGPADQNKNVRKNPTKIRRIPRNGSGPEPMTTGTTKTNATLASLRATATARATSPARRKPGPRNRPRRTDRHFQRSLNL